MGAVAWVPAVGAIAGAVALVVSARVNARATTATGVDQRAQQLLEQALAYADGELGKLRARVEGLEVEVQRCEAGRDDDRAAWRAEVAGLRAELAALRAPGGAP